jgi:phage terminase small subunit
MSDDAPDFEELLAALPAKRRAFVVAYVGEAARNATEAARIAGYGSPTSQASRLLTFANVSRAIAAFERASRKATVMSKAEREEWLTRVIAGEIEETIVTVKGGTKKAPARIRDRIQAATLLSRMRGELTDKVEATHHGIDGVLSKMNGVYARKRARDAGGAKPENDAPEGADEGE